MQHASRIEHNDRMIERTVSMVPLELLQGGTRCSTGYTENTAVIQTECISSEKLLLGQVLPFKAQKPAGPPLYSVSTLLSPNVRTMKTPALPDFHRGNCWGRCEPYQGSNTDHQQALGGCTCERCCTPWLCCSLLYKQLFVRLSNFALYQAQAFQ